MTNRLVFVLFVLWGCTLSAPPAQAQPYPAKAIRFIVPYPPGGGTDLFARTLAPALSEGFGQQVVVENRAGAQGNIGVAAVAKATPDGYTIGLTDTSTLTMNPAALHLDEDYCRKHSPFGQRIVNSAFTLGLIVGLSVGGYYFSKKFF